MKAVKEISLRSYFNATTLNTREEADRLFDFIKNVNEDKVVVDAKDIEFVSRSFAHQFYINRLELTKEEQIDVELKNFIKAIEDMFSAVVKTTNNYSRTNSASIEVIRFKDFRNFYSYLSGL